MLSSLFHGLLTAVRDSKMHPSLFFEEISLSRSMIKKNFIILFSQKKYKSEINTIINYI